MITMQLKDGFSKEKYLNYQFNGIRDLTLWTLSPDT